MADFTEHLFSQPMRFTSITHYGDVDEDGWRVVTYRSNEWPFRCPHCEAILMGLSRRTLRDVWRKIRKLGQLASDRHAPVWTELPVMPSFGDPHGSNVGAKYFGEDEPLLRRSAPIHFVRYDFAANRIVGMSFSEDQYVGKGEGSEQAIPS